MTQAQAQALAKMHAANAALTPEQRKARSVAAAEASKARKAGTPTPKVDAPSAPMPNRVWLVSFVVEHEGKRGTHTVEGVSAPTIKRAVREARGRVRQLHAEWAIESVAGVFDRDLAKLAAFVA